MKGKGLSHNFSAIYLHLNWHCKGDAPMIRPEIEAELHGFIQGYCRKQKGVHFEGVGGTEDHIHLAFQMEPFVSMSDFIGQVKGASSHRMNQVHGPGTLKWQRGYGIVSFSKKYLPGVLRYIENQKKHHAQGTTNATMEVYGEDVDMASSGKPR